MVKFNPATDIPSLEGKVIVVTGGNIGLGKESVLQLAHHQPAKIYLAARSAEKGNAAIAEIHETVPDAAIMFLELDLASFESVQSAAEKIKLENDRLDILMNNAGVMCIPHAVTKEGYEIQFGTNHMGHALFIKFLMPLLLSTAAKPNADVRVINLSSGAHLMGSIMTDQVHSPMENQNVQNLYNQSKLANVLFTKELAAHFPTILSVSVHPGRVKTNLTTTWFTEVGDWRSKLMQFLDPLIMRSVEQGALAQLWASVAERSLIKPGEYYSDPGYIGYQSGSAKNKELAKQFWAWTEEELEKHGYGKW
ncbi:hypothetical protein MMC25_006701 [Agyrium rufum]|nr:hypothetical protein [Agyrium rufum]